MISRLGRFGPGWLVAYALPPVAWAGVIFWLSSRTASQAGDALGPLADVPLVSEAFHFGEYCLLAFLVFRLMATVGGLRRAAPPGSPVQALDLLLGNVSGAASFAYAISDEVHQTFVPGRTFAVEDLAVDLAGIVTGIAAAWAWRWWRNIRCRQCHRSNRSEPTTSTHA
ncbi:MAG: VanZ family protein [Chloroflexi bacterium]|nr:VanZ family protein [Chloroflexota bacterium]